MIDPRYVTRQINVDNSFFIYFVKRKEESFYSFMNYGISAMY